MDEDEELPLAKAAPKKKRKWKSKLSAVKIIEFLTIKRRKEERRATKVRPC